MGNLNKVMLIGRLTREPEIKEFSGGGKVALLGLAVNNRRRNQETGQWEDVPVWMELKAFNHEHGRKLADLAGAHLHRGQELYVEGRLALEQWDGRDDGKKHYRTLIYVESVEFLGGGKKAAAAAPGAEAPEGRPGAEQPAGAAGKRKPGRPRSAAAGETPPGPEEERL